MRVLLPLSIIAGLTACSNTGGLTTASINNDQKVAKKPAIDPACVTLVSKIDSLRKDGITDRVAKAGEGKSKTVPVYRASLARMAELDRANAEYQRRCGTLKPATAAVRPATPPVAATAKTTAKTAAVNTAKTKATTAAKTATTKAVTKAAVKKSTTAVPPVKTIAKADATKAAADAAKAEAQKRAVEEAAKAAEQKTAQSTSN